MGDNNPTVEVNGTELEIIETADGFEARETEPDPNTKEKFEEEVAAEGDSLHVGSISTISQNGYSDNPRGVLVYVSDSGYDVMAGMLSDAVDAGWNPTKIEFEKGYVRFKDTEDE